MGAGRTLELIETKEIEQLLKTIIDVSTSPRAILSFFPVLATEDANA